MAESAAVQVGCEVGKSLVTEWLWPRIKCHLDYWRCFRDNVQGLSDEIRLLKTERRNMDQKKEEAMLRAERITAEVEDWSQDGHQMLEEAERVLRGCDGLKAWNIISRYSWGKRAKKTAANIAQLRNGANAIRISDPPPIPARAPIPHKPAMKFDSRRRIEEDIMQFLKDDHVCMVAICGAGGIGKTTMVQRIEDRVREEKLFDEVVHVVVSQRIDMLEIQKKIAEYLGLKFTEDTLVARAHKLNIRLEDSKRKLIVFDDVWDDFDLGEIGVPSGNGFTRCKIILTSRVTYACNRMGAQEIIQMEVLKEEEAWDLFKEEAGGHVEDPDFLPIAKDVAAECRGLPIALVNVGRALKYRSIPVWRNSLSQLKRSMPTDFPDLIKDVYKPLKLSYDFLENESVKSIFLLCCMFPEDYNIPIENLTLYAIGLDMFEGIKNIDEGRDRTYGFVEELKSSFLLLDGDRRHHVKMHDVVRDVAIFIGSKEKNGWFLECLEVSSMDLSSKDLSSNCNWMSIDFRIEIDKLCVGSNFPNLSLLMIRDSDSHDGNIICFEGMKGLNVLSISNQNIHSLMPTMKMLKKLRALHLHRCYVKDISVLGELANLKILCIHECGDIEVLSADIGRLNHLKLLELSSCLRLKKIIVGVISSLVRLEALKIIDCERFKWEAKGSQSEERNAGLSELGSLQNLASLEIDIFDYNLFAEEMCLSQQLVRYFINGSPSYLSYYGREYDRTIRLRLPGFVTVGNWIQHLVRSTQSLESEGDGSNNLIVAESESLRNLVIKDCSTMKKLVSGMDCKLPVLVNLKLIGLTELEEIIDGTIPEGSNSFQRLESLIVEKLPKLAHLWKSPNQNVSPGNLKSISIVGCPNLCYLFSVATARSLVQLQVLLIENCDKIEHVFWNEMESNTDASIMEFPKLQKLTLTDLPNLAAFSQGVEIIESLHQLTTLKIENCPKLRTKIGKCSNLKIVSLYSFNGPHDFLSSCRTIEDLRIEDCESTEEILWDEIKDEGEHHIIFPELIRLELRNLPGLTTLCNLPGLTTLRNLPGLTTLCSRGVEGIKFPKLEWMVIGNLPRLKSVLPLDLEATHDHHSLHFFCNPKVEIPCLKTLGLIEIQDVISNIWCRHVPINFFHNLKELVIYDANGISNFISYSIAKNLVNLETLYIKGCHEMVDVIEDEKEVSATPLFRKLRGIYIQKSHKLRSFCQWKHALELPSLEEVTIVDCPGMETFTLGSLSTPYLSDFRIDGKQVETKDLNGGIRDRFRFKIDEEENEDEGDEHENSSEEENEDDELENSSEEKKEVEDEEKVESSKSTFM